MTAVSTASAIRFATSAKPRSSSASSANARRASIAVRHNAHSRVSLSSRFTFNHPHLLESTYAPLNRVIVAGKSHQLIAAGLHLSPARGITNVWIIVALMLLGLPTTASAVTHVAPAPGASTSDLHPTFSWTLDGHEVNVIQVSKLQRTTVDGEFYDEDHVTGDALDSSATAWQPTSAIPSGTYWWNVQWYTPDFSSTGYTAPTSFRIPPDIHGLGQRLSQSTYSPTMTVTASWWSNTPTTKATCSIYRKGRRVARTSDSSSYPTIGGTNTAYCYLRLRERWDGLRFKAVLTVSGGGIARSTSRYFTAR